MFGCSIAGWHGWLGIPVWLLLLAVVFYMIARFTNTGKRSADRNDSLAILQRRLAAGEISVEEFLKLKQYL